MPAFRYNKAADWRDQSRADYLRKQTGLYHRHSDLHLANALRYARGCSGCEAKAREDMIRAEMQRRGNGGTRVADDDRRIIPWEDVGDEDIPE